MALGCTPRELLARTTSAEITEAMAWERLEPFGSLHLEALIGRLCSLIGNVHRKPGSEPFRPDDFMPALAAARRNYAPLTEDGAILMDDPKAQAALIRSLIKAPSNPEGEE